MIASLGYSVNVSTGAIRLGTNTIRPAHGQLNPDDEFSRVQISSQVLMMTTIVAAKAGGSADDVGAAALWDNTECVYLF